MHAEYNCGKRVCLTVTICLYNAHDNRGAEATALATLADPSERAVALVVRD